MKVSNSTVPHDMDTFDNDLIEFWDLSGQIVNDRHDQQLALSSPAECAQTSGSAANHRTLCTIALVDRAYPQGLGDLIIDEATPGMQGYFPATPAEGPHSLFGLYDSVTDGTPTQGRLLGEASTFGDWPLFEDPLIDPPVGDGFFPQMLPQLDLFEFPTQPSYPTTGDGQAFQPIAPAPALNAVVQPNIITPPSRAYAAARRRTIEPRFHCNIDGCTKAYRRVGDCRRHMRKHQAPTLRCVVEGCIMKFDRMDKLRDHVRQGHKMNL